MSKEKRSFPLNFWISILMEFFERGAYYGVLSVLSVYLVLSGNEGGLELSKQQAGTIMGTIQPLLYFLPIIAGGIADRLGYRRILFFAFSCITLGYLFAGISRTYAAIFAALLLMALGAGFFKPVISGSIAKSTTKENSSLGFGIFYWSINLGAFLVPLFLIPYLKGFGYNYIFYMAAAIGCILFAINTFLYKDPTKQGRVHDGATDSKSMWQSIKDIFVGIVSVFKDVRFIVLILLYSGFWILYFQMYGTVLWYLKDHVDMTPVNVAVNNFLAIFVDNPNWVFDTEHVTVVNAGAIICLQLIISKLLQKTKALPTMMAGIACGTLGMFILSLSSSPWIFICGLVIFTLGEMTTHPKFISYIGEIAPKDKTALYMGYSFLYGVIGSGVGSFLGAQLYVHYVDTLNEPRTLWAIFSIIGVASIVGLFVYEKVVKRK